MTLQAEPSPATYDRPSAVLAGAALAACAVGLALGWFGPFELSPATFAATVPGACLGLWVSRRGGAWFLLMCAIGLILGPGGRLVSSQILAGAVMLGAGLGAGAIAGDVAARLGPVRTLAWALLGAGAVAAAGDLPIGWRLWATLGGAFGLIAGFLPPKDSDEPEARWLPRGPTWTAAPIALRIGATLVVGAKASAYVLEGGAPIGSLGGALWVGPTLALAVGLGLFLGAAVSALRSRGLPVILEPLGWLAVLTLAHRAPDLLLDGFGLRVFVGVSGGLAGIALAGPLSRGGVWGLAGIVLAAPVGGAVFEFCEAGWPTSTRVALALGIRGPAVARLVDDSVRVRFEEGSPRVVVVDLVARTLAVRVLSVNGVVQGTAPTHAKGPRGPTSGHVLAAALPHLVAPEPPKRIALLGLGLGVGAGTALLSPALEELAVVEPVSGVVGMHRDPGDLFGYLNHRPLDDRRLDLRRDPLGTFLRLQPKGRWDAVVALRSKLRAPFLRSMPAHARLFTWRVESPSGAGVAKLAANIPLYAFDVGEDAFVLLGLRGGLSLPRMGERFAAFPALRAELALHGLGGTFELLSALVAGPKALAGLQRTGPVDRERLLLTGARELPTAIEFGESGADAMASLAEHFALRKSPAALPMADAALARARTPRTLRVRGDLLLQVGDEDAAQAAWAASLELDPGSVATYLSIAVFHEGRAAWKAGTDALTPALGVDPARDPQVRFHLGKLAIGAKDYRRARKHLAAAGDFKNAKDLLEIARQLSNTVEPGKVPPALKLRAAAKMVDRAARASAGPDAVRLWTDAVTALLPLAHDPAPLSATEQVRLARLLARCAETRAPVAAAVLHRLRAAVLEGPAADMPRHAITRGRALAAAGEVDQAESLLATLAEHGPVRAEAARALGDVLGAQEKWDAAVLAYQRCLSSSPQSSLHVRVYLALAHAQRRRGQPERALRALRTAERLQPEGHPAVRLALADLLLAVGQRGEARDAYRAFLEVAPRRHSERARAERTLADLSKP